MGNSNWNKNRVDENVQQTPCRTQPPYSQSPYDVLCDFSPSLTESKKYVNMYSMHMQWLLFITHHINLNYHNFFCARWSLHLFCLGLKNHKITVLCFLIRIYFTISWTVCSGTQYHRNMFAYSKNKFLHLSLRHPVSTTKTRGVCQNNCSACMANKFVLLRKWMMFVKHVLFSTNCSESLII